jgi:hypothetical protein
MSLFSRWSQRKPDPAASKAPAPEPASEPPTTSKVLPKFLSALAQLEAPALLDLGPVVGQNVAFFGDRLSCKLHVEDLFAVVDAHARAGTRALVADAIVSRLQRHSGHVDGILCWDLFDYLDRKTAPAVAAELVKLLAPNGVVHGFFGTKTGEITHYTRFIVEAPDQFRQRVTPAPATPRTVFVTRDITKMFDGLRVTETVLLKNSVQEVMLKRTG